MELSRDPAVSDEALRNMVHVKWVESIQDDSHDDLIDTLATLWVHGAKGVNNMTRDELIRAFVDEAIDVE